MAWIKSETFKIFHNTDKKAENFPDWTGSLDLDGPMIKAIVDQWKAERKATLKIAFWNAVQSNNGSGKEYFNANLSTQGEQQAAPTPPPSNDDGIDDIPF